MILNVHWSSRNVSLILVGFQCNFNLLDCISKTTQISNFVTFHPVGAELLHADGHGEANVAFRHSANTPVRIKNCVHMLTALQFVITLSTKHSIRITSLQKYRNLNHQQVI
jgi:hypothetical protein